MPVDYTVRRARHFAARVEDAWHAHRERRARERGWVATILPYKGYGLSSEADGWIRIFSRVVMARPGVFEDGQHRAKVIADGVRGWRNFISPPVAGGKVRVEVGGSRYDVAADRGGVLDVRVAASLSPGWHRVTLSTEGSAPVTSQVFMVDSHADFGMLSDVDDTVVVTALPRPLLAAWNSFVLSEHARVATPGMAVMMERVMRSRPGAPTLYLSTGAWNVAQTLTRFLSRNLYPEGALLLTDWGPTEVRWFRSGMQHKADQLRRLAVEFPGIKWLLIGDDGQHDPVLYAEFARRYPGHVLAIVIRQLTPSEAVLAGGRTLGLLNSTPGVPWVYEPDGSRIAAQLERLGIIENETTIGAD
ncbi:App1 family protein [Paeniglutamicibacter cryotolerans]|uniref:Phosphatidate phosphatase APP1 n=1 Tax=Paeniglutamicibacter cryotolerans TaxID=670079 RepID=A0A839QNC7_9MICC|nr:phosphatase domain-containing protein [Paeniglutamicibacter cryotolerans]MBB2995506.1 phosphatidate phosphatase APP1 [Paeniglutamicibacter cryotolerans]